MFEQNIDTRQPASALFLNPLRASSFDTFSLLLFLAFVVCSFASLIFASPASAFAPLPPSVPLPPLIAPASLSAAFPFPLSIETDIVVKPV